MTDRAGGIETQPRPERGVVLAVAAMLMVTLLVFTAIVVDLGNARQKRRDAQNDVDAAALAGVVAYDGSDAGAAAARARAVEFLAVNGRPSAATADPNVRTCGSPTSCTITLHFTPPPQATPPQPNATSRYCIRVSVVDQAVPTYFAGVIGIDNVHVNTRASACQRFSGGSGGGGGSEIRIIPGALALGTCSVAYESFETSGNDNRFLGEIHSNGGARDIGTNNTRLVGASATVRVAFGQPSDIVELWTGATVVPTAREDPVTPGPQTPQDLINRYAPGGDRAAAAAGLGLYTSSTSDITFSGNIPAGIYYTTASIIVSGTGVSVTPRNGHTGVTLVATGGTVQLGGNGIRLTPFSLGNPDRLTVIGGWDSTGNPCSDTGLTLGGECVRVDGIMYVPFTKATFSNNGNGHDDNGRPGPNCVDTPAYSGGLIAYALKLDGNQNVLRGGVLSDNPELIRDVFLDE